MPPATAHGLRVHDIVRLRLISRPRGKPTLRMKIAMHAAENPFSRWLLVWGVPVAVGHFFVVLWHLSMLTILVSTGARAFSATAARASAHGLETFAHDKRKYDQRCRGVSPSDMPDRVQSNAHEGDPREISAQRRFGGVGSQRRAVRHRGQLAFLSSEPRHDRSCTRQNCQPQVGRLRLMISEQRDR